MLRRALIAATVCALGALLGASHASAARPSLPHAFTSTETPHFVVHYTSDTLSADYTTFTQASDLASRLEAAYATEVGYGFKAPLDDGDGKLDVYVQTLGPDELGETWADNPAGPTSSAYIILDPSAIDDVATIAHELFHAIQFATWVPTQQTDTWLFEGSAEWMGAKVDGFAPGDAGELGPSDLPLDCRESLSPSPSYQMCSPDFYIEGGYSRWPFFQAIAARYGTTFIQTVLARGATGMTAVGALQAAIAGQGGSLSDIYGDWAIQQMTGTYGIPALDATSPTPYATVQTGIKSTNDTPATLQVPVDHLATRYVAFARGDGAADHACFAATLTVTVINRSGVATKPTLFWNAKGSAPVRLVGSGSTLSATIPWDTCMWAANVAMLALPNESTSVDAAPFTVTSSIQVSSTPAGATAPPDQTPVYGGQTDVSSATAAPSITVLGPLLLQVSATTPTLRLIVQSSGDGEVHAMLGPVDLGSPDVRAGNNDLHFTIPATLLSTLRRSLSTGTNVLTLTPVSSNGQATGTAVTRTVAVQAAPKAKPKTKPKRKKKH